MSSRGALAMGWSVEPSEVDGRAVAVVQGPSRRELRIQLDERAADWLVRGRHPAYAWHLRPILDALTERALWLELSQSPQGEVASTMVGFAGGQLHRKEIPVGLALLLCRPHGLRLYVDEVLLEEVSDEDHPAAEIAAFARFLESVTAEDFARFDHGEG